MKTARQKRLAPQVGLEPTTLRLTAECSAIELLRSVWRWFVLYKVNRPVVLRQRTRTGSRGREITLILLLTRGGLASRRRCGKICWYGKRRRNVKDIEA
jgi:hypothetical protein